MKIIRIFLGVFLSIVLSSPSYAAAPAIKFTAYPSSPQTVQVGGQVNLQYTVQNTIPAAQPIQSYSFTAAPNYSTVITDNCSESVPANGACIINVQLMGIQAGPVDNPVLTVYYGEPGMYVASHNTLTINVASATPPHNLQHRTCGSDKRTICY